MKPNRTGIWIPVWIEQLRLSHSQTKLLAEIVSLHEKGGCFASNKYLSEVLGLKQDTISRMITELKKKGLIKQTGFDGRRRFLAPCITEIPVLDKTPNLLKPSVTKVQTSISKKSNADSVSAGIPLSTIKVQQNIQTINPYFNQEKIIKSKSWEKFLEWSRGKVSKTTWSIIQNSSDPNQLSGLASLYWNRWQAI